MSDVGGEYGGELERIRRGAQETGDRRLAAMAAALDDERVRQLLHERRGAGHTYGGTRAFYAGDRIRLVFEFERAQGSFTLTRPRFAVDVDPGAGTVVGLTDPYLDPEAGGAGAVRSDLDLSRFTEDDPGGQMAPDPKLAWSKLSHWA
ncbi:MAG TPA: hypothetical protein VF640_05315 [Acidimicrobiales bacterium]|jgi:hypothetical protein